jgi:hypothetical protein
MFSVRQNNAFSQPEQCFQPARAMLSAGQNNAFSPLEHVF